MFLSSGLKAARGRARKRKVIRYVSFGKLLEERTSRAIMRGAMGTGLSSLALTSSLLARDPREWLQPST
jgi:hypothetical protein